MKTGTADAVALVQQTAIDAEGVRQAELRGHNAIALPADYNVHRLEGISPTRDRWRGTYKTDSIEDFARAVHEQSGARTFLDADHWRATSIFNYAEGDVSSGRVVPGHCDFKAVLQLQPTPEWTALVHLAGHRYNQRDLVDFLEDWAHCIPGFENNAGESVSMAQAIAAIRSVSVTSAKQSTVRADEMKTERGVMESIEAREADSFPVKMQWACIPAMQLPPIVATVRMAVLTSHETPVIATRIVAKEALEHHVAGEFRILLMAKLDTPPFLGVFDAGQ